MSHGELPVTRRLHEDDSWLFRFDARVLAAHPVGEGIELALDRSAFYVESGGQPADRGQIDSARVLALRLEDGVVWHLVAAPPPTASDRSGAGRFARGTTVVGEVDSETRVDHMQQHTGQHILSQAFLRAGGRATRSFHLGLEESTIDLDGAKPDDRVMADAVGEANGCVMADRPIRVHRVPRAELDRYPLRREPGEEREVQRLIEIEEYDWSACGGTHARRTGEVGAIHVMGIESVRSLWRIRFVAGWRTLRYLTLAHQALHTVARAASVRWDQVPEAAEMWRAETAAANRELRRLRSERGERAAERLFAEIPPSDDGIRRLGVWLGEIGAEELRALANRFVALGPSYILAGGRDGERAAWVVARSSEPSGAPDAGGVLRAWLAPLGGKGGGSNTYAQGTAPAPDEAALPTLLRALEGWAPR